MITTAYVSRYKPIQRQKQRGYGGVSSRKRGGEMPGRCADTGALKKGDVLKRESLIQNGAGSISEVPGWWCGHPPSLKKRFLGITKDN
jgi:hypothetical protein